jgi:hypothetical protein
MLAGSKERERAAVEFEQARDDRDGKLPFVLTHYHFPSELLCCLRFCA